VKATDVVLTKVMNMRHVREYALRARPEDRRAGGPEVQRARGSEGQRTGGPEGRNGEGTDGQKTGGAEGQTGSVVVQVYQMGADGAAAELHVAVEPALPPARAGAGGVHHVAFRTPTSAEYDQWAARLVKLGMPSSGPVDRYYFRSLYFREPNGILFEIATDGPGFAADESMDALGERLALPPFLESRRAAIEAELKPLPDGKIAGNLCHG
jgi:catechol 2,3-dioxygenase-like lactoylglutathione lyase family enzyme